MFGKDQQDVVTELDVGSFIDECNNAGVKQPTYGRDISHINYTEAEIRTSNITIGRDRKALQVASFAKVYGTGEPLGETSGLDTESRTTPDRGNGQD